MKMIKKYKTVTEYINFYPKDVATKLKTLRNIIKKIAPDAEESISYGMPAYKMGGPLVYFAAFDEHIGFYPTPSIIKEFKSDLSLYKTSKGAIKFPLTTKLPLGLITDMVKYRLKELQIKNKDAKKNKTR
ncbi:MAG: DUF1801 domain-containing protein [Parcubacteria group bacterium]